MNTTTATQVTATDILHAKNVKGIRWTQDAHVYEASGRAYGITDGAGRWLSSDGAAPSYWSTLSTARMVVEDLVAVSHSETFTPEGIRTGWSWIAAN